MGVKCPKCNTDNPDTQKFCGECATPLPSSKEIPVTETLETPKEELTTGSTFAGRYQIIEELGKGGMGKVYKAIDKKLNEEVALKIIKPEIASDKKTLERFNNELKFARKIAHKNVGRMYELMEEKSTHFITMEYVPGQDLRGLIRQSGQLAVGTALSIAKQVCEGLTEAHRLGVIHRDLKPQNIMIDKEGNARIMDFGIARSITGKGITGAGVMVGTPEYISPEQVESKETDQRSDIYSLGVILYEMVTGRVPFEGDTPLSVAVKHKTEAPPDPRQINTQIPEDLGHLILRCMEKEKEKRYQSAGEVHSELAAIEKGIPTTERIEPKRKPITSKEITVTFGLKKLLIPAVAIVALIVVGLILLSPWSKKASTPPPSDKTSLAIVYFENNTGDENMDRWCNGLANLLTDDLSQSRLLNVLSGDRLYTVLKKLNLLDAKSYSSEDLKSVAEQSGVQNILSGRLDKAGNIVRISTRLQNMETEELLGTRRIDTQDEEGFLDAVDELTRMIKTDLNLNSQDIASDPDKAVREITTNSSEAYRFYSEGRKYHNRGDNSQSIPFMERAIEIDPEFALAYRSLAMSHGNQGNRVEAGKYLKKAFELSDRASDIERYWIQGDYYRMEGNYDKAIEIYNKLFELDPNHTIGHHNISVLYRNLEEWDKAIEHLEVCWKNKTEFIGSYVQLGYSYAAKGMYQKAREVFMDYIENYSTTPRIRDSLALIYACEGEYELALVEAEKALALNPSYPTRYRKWRIYQLMGKYEDAEKEYKKLLETENNIWHLEARSWLEILYRSYGQYKKAREQAKMGLELAEKLDRKNWVRTYLFRLACNHWNAGNYDEALEEAEKCWTRVVEDNVSKKDALFLKALIYNDLGQDERAQAATEEMKIILEGGRNPNSIRDFYLLQGIIELKNKNYPKAIDYLNRAYALMPEQTDWYDLHAFFVYFIGSAYLLSGDFEEAERAFVKVTAMTTGRLFWGDLYTKSFYMLGKIYEKQGDKAKAIEHYEKFLDLWKDADPGIAEVEDAKKRLAGLKI